MLLQHYYQVHCSQVTDHIIKKVQKDNPARVRLTYEDFKDEIMKNYHKEYIIIDRENVNQILAPVNIASNDAYVIEVVASPR